MSYGLLGLRQKMEGEAMQGLGDLAGQQRQAKVAADQMKQAESAQKMSAVGTGAGIGMMAGGPVGAAIGAGVGFLASSIF
ncbi:bacteriocin [Halomonas sp. N3-2A]|uniref:bacteriocin n=1 Tax=Halomonas sp. N3-2A TaxID=2014541 RepID=UPI000B5B10A5|nr:bacteriocin [Halomonas sp. N3-2A]ASK18848.1 bacteriocin [Halomonas sp. N3-2A]